MYHDTYCLIIASEYSVKTDVVLLYTVGHLCNGVATERLVETQRLIA